MAILAYVIVFLYFCYGRGQPLVLRKSKDLIHNRNIAFTIANSDETSHDEASVKRYYVNLQRDKGRWEQNKNYSIMLCFWYSPS